MGIVMNTISRLMKFARGLIKFDKDGHDENAFHKLYATAWLILTTRNAAVIMFLTEN